MTDKLEKGLYGEKIEKIVPISEYEEHDFDEEEEDTEREDSDNPFKELRNLITAKDIDVKTVLSEKQVTRLQKINMLHSLLQTAETNLPVKSKDYLARKESIIKVRKLVDNYQNSFMKLIINKDGLSRKQFIEALHKGSEKAEQSQQQKIQQLLNI